MGPAQQSPGSQASTTFNDISATAFYVVTWIFFAICNIAFAARAYFRYTCFRRLLVEDYLMLLALAIYDAQAILIQLSFQSAYELESVEMVDLSKTAQPDIFTDLRRGTVTVGTSYILIIVGVLVIKLNLLLFFRRLDVKAYKRVTILWWIVLNFTVAGAMAQIAVLKLDCIFGSVEHIFGGACSTESTFQRNLVIAIFSSTVDAVSDLLIIAFPVAILWRSRISMRKKLALTFIFSLAFLTIAITIVRGSVFHSTRATAAVAWTKRATFIWFWYYCEFSVAILIACIVSFRTVFIQRKNKAIDEHQKQQRREAAYRSAIRRGWVARKRQCHDSLLETCKSLEDCSHSNGSPPLSRLPGVPSGFITDNFDDDGNCIRGVTRGITNGARSSVDGPISAHSVLKIPDTAHVYGVAR